MVRWREGLMVSYYISTPRKQGNQWVVDVSEHYSGSTTRNVTIKLEDVSKFISSLFHGQLHEDYKVILG